MAAHAESASSSANAGIRIKQVFIVVVSIRLKTVTGMQAYVVVFELINCLARIPAPVLIKQAHGPLGSNTPIHGGAHIEIIVIARRLSPRHRHPIAQTVETAREGHEIFLKKSLVNRHIKTRA